MLWQRGLIKGKPGEHCAPITHLAKAAAPADGGAGGTPCLQVDQNQLCWQAFHAALQQRHQQVHHAMPCLQRMGRALSEVLQNVYSSWGGSGNCLASNPNELLPVPRRWACTRRALARSPPRPRGCAPALPQAEPESAQTRRGRSAALLAALRAGATPSRTALRPGPTQQQGYARFCCS